LNNDQTAPHLIDASFQVNAARAFFNHFVAMHEAVGRPLTEEQKLHSKRWIWDSMKRGYKPMLIAPEHVYRHPEDSDAD